MHSLGSGRGVWPAIRLEEPEILRCELMPSCYSTTAGGVFKIGDAARELECHAIIEGASRDSVD